MFGSNSVQGMDGEAALLPNVEGLAPVPSVSAGLVPKIPVPVPKDGALVVVVPKPPALFPNMLGWKRRRHARRQTVSFRPFCRRSLSPECPRSRSRRRPGQRVRRRPRSRLRRSSERRRTGRPIETPPCCRTDPGTRPENSAPISTSARIRKYLSVRTMSIFLAFNTANADWKQKERQRSLPHPNQEGCTVPNDKVPPTCRGAQK